MVIIKCVILYAIREINHNFNGMMVLQKFMVLLENETGSCTEMCLTSDDGNYVVGIKAEEVTDVTQEYYPEVTDVTQEDHPEVTDVTLEDHPEPVTSPVVKAQPAVSCMSVCIQDYAHCTDVHCCLSLGLCSLSFCPQKHLESGEWILKTSDENVSGLLYFMVHCL